MKSKKYFCLFLGTLTMTLTAISVNGQEITKKEKPKESRFGFVVLPVLFYMPETKWGGGVGGLITFRPLNSPATARPSSLYFYVVYTQLKQFATQFEPELYFKNEGYLLAGKMTLERYPDKFWGVGNRTSDDAEENFTSRAFSLEASFQKRILSKQKLYAGIFGLFENYKIFEIDPGGSLEKQEYPGSAGGTVSSLGFILNWDTRDNIFYPTQGYYCQLYTHYSGEFLGSDFNMTSIKLDLRKYLPLFSTQVLAFQGLLQSALGTPPFKSYAKLGGDVIMRGYYSGRYRDKYLLALQAEYRLPVWRRLGMVAFAGIGDVADRLKSFEVNSLKYSAGFGLRFKIAPKEGTNLRLDFAWGKGTSGIYFTAGEAF